LIYVGFNFGQDTIGGWGVPMATDIAFAIGIMALLGKKAPLSLKVFLTALAIVDDLGAVLVIALFYSSNIDVLNLVFGAIVLILMFGGNWAGIRNVMFYAVLGIGGLWPAFLLSGVHATVAGVLGALAIPTDMRINKFQFRDDLQALVQTFTKLGNPKSQVLEEEQLHTLNSVNKTIGKVQPTLQKLEHNMHPWVMYGVMPIFALANAGVVFTGDALGNMSQHPVSLGVFLGLLLGKVGGVTLFSWIAQKLRIADLPTGTNWVQVTGAGFMAGIGFTMSLFITALAFDSSEMQDFAKMGILFASLIAGVAGFLMIRNSNPHAPSEDEQH
jgi:NhaA family Na+:H+ antiporter